METNTDMFEQDDNVPEWHYEILNERIIEYHANPDNVLDFEKTIKELEEKLLKRRL